jgi:hypothetical protein
MAFLPTSSATPGTATTGGRTSWILTWAIPWGRQRPPRIADALHLRSRARYNDGFPVRELVPQPMDGVVLARYAPVAVYLPIVRR